MYMSTIHQSPMHAIEEHEPFGVETTGPRVLRNENNLRNRVKREGRRATTRTASHQRLYNFVYFASKTAIQLAFRVLSQLPPIAPLPTAPSGSAIDTSAVTHGILVMSDALCAAAEAMFDAIGDECEITLQTTPIQDASTSTTQPASSPLRTEHPCGLGGTEVTSRTPSAPRQPHAA